MIEQELEQEYLQKSREIENQIKALYSKQKDLDAAYIERCAPFDVGTKLVARNKFNNKTFVCWVVGYCVQFNKIVMVYNDAKNNGERSMRQYKANISNLEMRICDDDKDNKDRADGLLF
jgi:hypothetical protein|nr:MAG TPA: hypothetical protein [Caudoviricetes sp.]